MSFSFAHTPNPLKSRQKGIISERSLQVAYIHWVRQQIATDERYGLIFAIPNGGWRSAREAASLKAQGVMRGVPDVLCAVPVLNPTTGKTYAGLWIEFKRVGGELSGEQERIGGLLSKVGYRFIVCDKLSDAIEQTKDYLDGKK